MNPSIQSIHVHTFQKPPSKPIHHHLHHRTQTSHGSTLVLLVLPICEPSSFTTYIHLPSERQTPSSILRHLHSSTHQSTTQRCRPAASIQCHVRTVVPAQRDKPVDDRTHPRHDHPSVGCSSSHHPVPCRCRGIVLSEIVRITNLPVSTCKAHGGATNAKQRPHYWSVDHHQSMGSA